MTTDKIDQFYADLNEIVIESIFAFEAEAYASMIDPETAPDPEFADMSAAERNAVLDEIEYEEWRATHEYDFFGLRY